MLALLDSLPEKNELDKQERLNSIRMLRNSLDFKVEESEISYLITQGREL